MSTIETILATAKKTLLSESKSIENLVNYLDEDFAKSVTEIYNTKGRLVVTGIGKSALIAQKIVATLNSTGTPSLFFIFIYFSKSFFFIVIYEPFRT